MKIDVTGNYNVYRQNISGENDNAAVKADTANQTAKTDVAAFAKGNSSIGDKALVSLKSALQRDLSEPTPPERIAQLQAEVKSGTYHVPTDDLINSILGE